MRKGPMSNPVEALIAKWEREVAGYLAGAMMEAPVGDMNRASAYVARRILADVRALASLRGAAEMPQVTECCGHPINPYTRFCPKCGWEYRADLAGRGAAEMPLADALTAHAKAAQESAGIQHRLGNRASQSFFEGEASGLEFAAERVRGASEQLQEPCYCCRGEKDRAGQHPWHCAPGCRCYGRCDDPTC